jgi:hypothetical protein
MIDAPDDILDDPFHGYALRAYLEVMAETGQFPPGSAATRQRAYQYYQEALAAKDAAKGEGTPPEEGEGAARAAPARIAAASRTGRTGAASG